jgi:F-type H+-transporting ATPase subunit delta
MAKNEELQTDVKSVLEDPSATAVARIYADAFLDACGDNADDALEEFGSFLVDVLAANPDFDRLLTSGIINRDDKIKLINNVVAPVGSELFTSFLRVLARHDRLELLPVILGESRFRHEERSGRRRVQVRSAVALSESVQNQLQQQLSQRFGFEAILETSDDPELIGGLVIQVGDTVYDASLKTRISQLRDRLRQRSLHEIQSGRDRFSHPEGD